MVTGLLSSNSLITEESLWMAPPGISTFPYGLDITTLSSRCDTSAAPLKLTAPTISALSIPSKMLSQSAPLSDHDYMIKTYNSCFSMDSDADENPSSLEQDYSGGGSGSDAMLSSAVDVDRVPDEGDTDFLKELDDMNFSPDDLDPCCEVAMEDSFQDFIDSALEQSYPSITSDCSSSNCGQEAVILNKEQFLAILDLTPAQGCRGSSHNELWSPYMFSVTPRSSFSSVSLLDALTSSIICQAASMSNTQRSPSYDAVPTKQCSCLELESMSKSVYSTAHASIRDSVRTCPSNLVTDNSNCVNCSQTKTALKMLSSPLYIDTSSTEYSDSFHSSTNDSHDFVMEDAASRVDKEAADIIKWLKESKQDDQQQYDDTSSSFFKQEHSSEVPYFTETSNKDSLVTYSIDLESFVDLDDYETKSEKQQDYIAYRTSCYSSSNDITTPCVSNFKFSIQRDNSNPDSYSEIYLYSDGSQREQQTSKPSDLPDHVFSPQWSRTCSVQSSVSPSSLASTDFSSSSDFEDTIEDSSVKHHLALLNLFSDDNATSLLHTDSTVSDIRFT